MSSSSSPSSNSSSSSGDPQSSSFDIGALVRARGREWVVLPETRDEPDILVVRPLGGTNDEITGIYLPLEPVEPAAFALPDPAASLGNHLSCSLLRDALRLGFRSGAGPFRSLAHIAIEPRPYQLVPLLMALELDPVRLLIADDVGIGKTIEALMIARELFDRGEIRRLAVLCPPHLAEQWQLALARQFHIDAALVLSGTAARLERQCRQSQSLFERFPFTVVSTDYIKSERRRHEFTRACPELVIVDEAHTCAASSGHSTSQRRHELLQALVDPATEAGTARHLLLVTATPHSGNQHTFRSLLALLNPDFRELPEDLGGEHNRRRREALARHYVQRRRGDLKRYLDTETPFPDREIAEDHYSLKPAYRKFFDKILAYCRETVLDEAVEKRYQRIRWWSALALLRALSSSPAAAAATLRNRSATIDGETVDDIDQEGRRAVLDLDDEAQEGIDVVPGSDTGENSARDKLLRLAREAESLAGKDDGKLARATKIVQSLIDDGHTPILFCRFIPTVTYLAEQLAKKFKKKDVTIEAITGLLPPEEREKRIQALGKHPKRILVCTDCLSEGINLQHNFDAVIHYDLSWNPTRHEQREGRVDRYGQPEDTVRTLTFYGNDNPVDGIVLQVLLRKHKAIHNQLGIMVPIPMETQVIENAIYHGLMLRETRASKQLELSFLEPIHEQVDIEWNAAVEREKRSRTLFAQNRLLDAINREVRAELDATRRALGGHADVEHFATTALTTLGATVSRKGDHRYRVNISELPRAAKDAIGAGTGDNNADITNLATSDPAALALSFGGRPHHDTIALTRTHPMVEGLAAHVLESALDPALSGPGRRCGAIRTRAAERRTTVLLLRLRFHIITRDRNDTDHPLLAEDLVLAGFTGSPDRATWLPEGDIEALLAASPDANIGPDQADNHLRRLLDRFEVLWPEIDRVAEARGQALFDAHRRVRKAVRAKLRALRVDVHKPADVLGTFIYLPAGGAL